MFNHADRINDLVQQSRPLSAIFSWRRGDRHAKTDWFFLGYNRGEKEGALVKCFVCNGHRKVRKIRDN